MNNKYGILQDKPMTAVGNRKKTLKQRFRDWLYDAEDYLISTSPQVTQDVHLSGNAIRFEVYFANGGRVIQTRRFDERKDRHYDNLYVITSDQDFCREIDKILTQEALRS